MPGPARTGALIYAKDVEVLSGFYQHLLGMRLLMADAERHVIESADMQIIIHAMPPHVASGVTILSPPQPRERQAIKLFFTVPSLATVAEVAQALGGGLFGLEYPGSGFKVRNGYDPEGNIFQVREAAR